MTVTRDLEGVLRALTFPHLISSNVAITRNGDQLTIAIPRMPLAAIYAWMAVVDLGIIVFMAYQEPKLAPLIAIMVVLGTVMFCGVMKFLEASRERLGPYATIGADIRTAAGQQIRLDEIQRVVEVFFRAERNHRTGSYRVVLVQDRRGDHHPILWQLATRHRWVRPTLDDLATRLAHPIETMEYRDVIVPEPT